MVRLEDPAATISDEAADRGNDADPVGTADRERVRLLRRHLTPP
jgi:hypothetical protein